VNQTRNSFACPESRNARKKTENTRSHPRPCYSTYILTENEMSSPSAHRDRNPNNQVLESENVKTAFQIEMFYATKPWGVPPLPPPPLAVQHICTTQFPIVLVFFLPRLKKSLYTIFNRTVFYNILYKQSHLNLSKNNNNV